MHVAKDEFRNSEGKYIASKVMQLVYHYLSCSYQYSQVANRFEITRRLELWLLEQLCFTLILWHMYVASSNLILRHEFHVCRPAIFLARGLGQEFIFIGSADAVFPGRIQDFERDGYYYIIWGELYNRAQIAIRKTVTLGANTTWSS